MAVVAGNSVMQNLRGALGKEIVFRQCGDKTVVSRMPSLRKKKRQKSELQQLYLNKFKDASQYARTVLRDPVKREHYTRLARKLKKHCAYNVVISEYMLSIRIQTEDTSVEELKDRRRIVIKATKRDFKVSKVLVDIKGCDGEFMFVVEGSRISASDWVFKLPQAPEKGAVSCYVDHGGGCVGVGDDQPGKVVGVIVGGQEVVYFGIKSEAVQIPQSQTATLWAPAIPIAIGRGTASHRLAPISGLRQLDGNCQLDAKCQLWPRRGADCILKSINPVWAFINPVYPLIY